MNGYEPEQTDVEAFVAPLESLPDPGERYARASAEQALHEAVGRRLARIRALAVLDMHQGGASFAAIAAATGLTRSRAQQLVEQGRAQRGR